MAHVSTGAQPTNNNDTLAAQAADLLICYLEAAWNVCMPPRSVPPDGKRNANWWNNDIARLRHQTNSLRRTSLTNFSPTAWFSTSDPITSWGLHGWKKITKISHSKSTGPILGPTVLAFDNDPWDIPNRVVTKKIGRRRQSI